ncbi:hypothetical protein IFM61606_02117 [Aspergillus udagawae]|uniref:Uncharacterized protein n=1 Tax=Aspergillus udagawae TaxID=91492 RepID=A0ABQ1B1B4_9EURO|nr:hypothetical protein IFM51744_02833 [Aspergillus udagawae]GFF91897.1 hypothetical protein IFM53868_06662 [Aspergillus udagawae]GFG10983.1 hypothetical protein IFM5058_05200 [Aspergillus udagawae]GFG22260.1 hypothetical protein IFM61606_02117 [Aspergillus udagawae]
MARSSFTAFLVVFTTVVTTISPSYAFNNLLNRASDSCPASYEQCNNSNLPSSFCCPSTSTCVSLDNGSSAICCPSGQSCAFIEPITCDVSQQNATLHPKAVVKTIRLGDTLPKCGNSCCPFGYSCQSNSICAMSTSTSAIATGSISSLPTTTSNPSSASTKASTDSTASTTSTAPTTATTSSKVTDTASSTDGVQPTIITASDPADSSASSAASNCHGTSTAVTTTCPSYPTKAIIAGFFPGAAFGAVLALLAMFLMRRRNNNLPPSVKIAQHTQRTSSGTLIGISDPIPSEENAYRTDFLLRRSLKRNSEGARSMLQRTGTRVKSLFGSTPKPSQMASKPPPLPLTPPQQVRMPSTESIKVYTPPGTFASTGVLRPEPYPTIVVENGATFTEMIDQVGFKNSKGDPSYRVNETPRSRSKSPLRPI